MTDPPFDLSNPTQLRAFRRQYRRAERGIKAIAILFGIGGTGSVWVAVSHSQLGTYFNVMSASILLAGTLMTTAAVELHRLQNWARLTVLLALLGVVVTLLAAIAYASVNGSFSFAIAVGAFIHLALVGCLASILSDKNSKMVCSQQYREVVSKTKYINQGHGGFVAWVVVLLFMLSLAILG